MVIDLPSSQPLQNGREWRVANPKNGYKTTGQGGGYPCTMPQPKVKFLHRMVAKRHSVLALGYSIL